MLSTLQAKFSDNDITSIFEVDFILSNGTDRVYNETLTVKVNKGGDCMDAIQIARKKLKPEEGISIILATDVNLKEVLD